MCNGAWCASRFNLLTRFRKFFQEGTAETLQIKTLVVFFHQHFCCSIPARQRSRLGFCGNG